MVYNIILSFLREFVHVFHFSILYIILIDFLCVCLIQKELPETNIIFYETANVPEFLKKIESTLTSIVESVEKERVSSTVHNT